MVTAYDNISLTLLWRAGQEFAKVGLQNCNINSSLPVGSVVQILFLVWDNGQPPLSATVNRTLVITSPCPSGELLCLSVFWKAESAYAATLALIVDMSPCTLLICC